MLTERVSALPNRSQAQKKGSMHPSLARKVLRREVQEPDLPGPVREPAYQVRDQGRDQVSGGYLGRHQTPGERAQCPELRLR